MNIICQLARLVNLKESNKVLEKFFIYLYIYKKMSTKDLAQVLQIPLPVVTAIKKEGAKLGVFSTNSGISLTATGANFVEQELGFDGINLELYQQLLVNRGFKNRYVNKMADRLVDVFEGRPQVDVTLDQAHSTTKTAVKRAMLALEHFSLIGKSILCVGDDDLVSVALSFLLTNLFLNKEHRTNITVIDTDQQILNYISNLNKIHGFNINTTNHDLKLPLPNQLFNKYDAVFTDPPYTHDGMSLFVSRGLDALKNHSGMNLFLSYGKKPINEKLNLQQTLINSGLILNAIIDDFNEYHGASFLGGRSQMLILETSNSAKPIIPTNQTIDNTIYTREKSLLSRTYKCSNCQEAFAMTTGQTNPFNTIEQLKQTGCPTCGTNNFQRLAKPTHLPNLNPPKAIGQHLIVDFFDCDENGLKDTNFIRDIMIEAAKIANATIVSQHFKTFEPWGVSGVIVISESHLTIHTWPEYQYAAVDLFTCDPSMNLQKAIDYLTKQLGSGRVGQVEFPRGEF